MVEILSYNPGSYVYENLTYVFYFDLKQILILMIPIIKKQSVR
jgi:hypothetical protein